MNWSKYQCKKTSQAQNRYLDILVDLNRQGVNILFVLSFENYDGRKSYKRYYLRTVEIKYCNVVTDGKNFFSQAINNDLKTLDID